MARLETLAIMFVDMAGFAERTARQSREQNRNLMRDFSGLIIPLIPRYKGRHVKSIGDAFLCAFRSPTDAVHCGMAMHDAVASYNRDRNLADPVQIRVALNLGEVRLEPTDVFGEAVNIAARVEELTPAGEIYLTGVVYLAMNKAEVPYEHIGEQMLKGIPEAVRLFRVPPYRLNRLTPAGEQLDVTPADLPYGGMHALSADSNVIDRVADSLRRAPYVDWSAKARAGSLRSLALGGGVALLATSLFSGAYWYVNRPEPPPPVVVAQPKPEPPSPVSTPISQEARDALVAANALYTSGKRFQAAEEYARVLGMAPDLRHDSGLAANLVGTLSYGGTLTVDTIRKNPSPELVYELGRRTGQPGRKGAQRAAALLTEFGQAGRIDQAGLASTDLTEATACEERYAAVRKLRALRDPRALPLLRDSVKRTWFRKDENACLREEARLAISELEQIAPPQATQTTQ